jgi:hypothetical protein
MTCFLVMTNCLYALARRRIGLGLDPEYFLYQRRAASTIASITASWGNKVHPILLARMKQTSNHEILDTVELTYRKLWDSGY